MRWEILKVFLWSIAFVFPFTFIAIAQDYRGKVQGIVTDSSQAAVVGATVTLRNANTGIDNSKQTDASGAYVFDFVSPGTYSISVEASGFQKFQHTDITVLTRGDVSVNAQLTVGAVAETINVTGRPLPSISTPAP